MTSTTAILDGTPVTEVRSAADDLDLLLGTLPEEIRTAIVCLPEHDQLIEVVLDLGRIPEARFPGRVEALLERPVSAEDLRQVVEHIGDFGKDNRAGIERTLHRISAIRNRAGAIIGLTCRVGRAVVGTIDIIRDVVEVGRSILLLGRPGVGKTTLLREAARVLADDLGKRVVVVDTSNEIAGDGDIPHAGIGRARRMQVPSPDAQHGVMIEAVENHMPEVIVIDEIGTAAETLAARTIAERGVQLIATAHGNTLENLLQNPTLADLVGGIQAVTLSDEEARRRRTRKTVLERKAPPTFDVVVEIQDRDQLAVHHGIAEVVDQYLRGVPLRPELRARAVDGTLSVERPTATAALEAAAPDLAGPKPRAALRQLRIMPFAVSRNKLDRAISDLGVPATMVDHLQEADVLLTVKAQERRQPQRLHEAARRGVRMAVVRSNTVKQLEGFLRAEFSLGEDPDDDEAALREVESVVDSVLDEGRPAELAPRNRYLRRIQHELVERYGLTSRSRGREPRRRVVIYPR